MTDVVDNGCELEQKQRDYALAAHKRRAELRLSDGYCVDCGDAIPQSRLQANAYAQRCIDCQSIHEQRETHFARCNH